MHGLLLAAGCALALHLSGLESLQAGAIYTVNSTADLPDTDPLDGIAQATNGACTLRAAVMQANFSGGGTIILPAGTYTLTRVGYDDGAIAGDLDITADLAIQGAGSGVTIVDGNGSVTHDRVFQVLPTVRNFTLSGLTIRNGESISTNDTTLGGGGLHLEGADIAAGAEGTGKAALVGREQGAQRVGAAGRVAGIAGDAASPQCMGFGAAAVVCQGAQERVLACQIASSQTT